MHSRIFQVSTEPISQDEYIIESNYYDHWFTNSVADYVSDDCNRTDDIEWLKDCYEEKGIEFGKDGSGEFLVIRSKIKYFEKSFERFKELLKTISNYDIADFIKGIYEFWELKNEYEEKFGFYMDTDDNGLITLDNFVRIYPENVKLYIGGTIDYHC
jgi:hypothetical protein